jgi:hypothetical protein
MIWVEEAHYAAMAYIPFAGTRGFVVAAGPVTINLVCEEIAGTVSVWDTSLTAIFVAQ